MPRRLRPCIGACGRRARAHACDACWTRLPEPLRLAIVTARRKTQAYSIALHNAHTWLVEHARGRVAS